MKAIVFIDYENIWKGLANRGYMLMPEEMLQILNRYSEKKQLDLLAVYVYANFDREEFWRTQTLFQKTNVMTRHVFSKNSFANTDLRNNAADLELMLEAQELLLTRSSTFDTFILITGDGDFLPLVRKIRTWGKDVRVIGIKDSIHHTLLPYCEEWDMFDELMKERPKNSYAPEDDIKKALALLGHMQLRMAYIASTKARAMLMDQLGCTIIEVKELIRLALQTGMLIEKEHADPSLKIGRTKIYVLNLEHPVVQEELKDIITEVKNKQDGLLS